VIDYIKRLVYFLEDDITWEESDLQINSYRKFIKKHPPDLVILETDMDKDLFLLHLIEFGFSSEDVFDKYLTQIGYDDNP